MLSNTAHAHPCMLCAWQPAPADALSAIGLSMFGVTTACVQGVTQALQGEFDSLVVHATGNGGQSLKKLANDTRAAMVDLTTTEIADLLCGGVLNAGDNRRDAPLRPSLHYISSCGALDMVNCWSCDTVPARLAGLLFHLHNANLTLMRSTPEENAAIVRWIAGRAVRDARSGRPSDAAMRRVRTRHARPAFLVARG